MRAPASASALSRPHRKRRKLAAAISAAAATLESDSGLMLRLHKREYCMFCQFIFLFLLQYFPITVTAVVLALQPQG